MSYSQSTMQPCGDFSGEPQPIQAPIPGFSHKQSISIRGLMTAIQFAMDQSFVQHFGPVQQLHSPPTSPPTQPNSPAKQKRNRKTRNQYKRKAKAERVMVQEVEQSHGQEVEHLDIQISVEKVSKHVFLLGDWMTTLSLGHAVIPYVGMASYVGMIIECGIGRPRSGVG